MKKQIKVVSGVLVVALVVMANVVLAGDSKSAKSLDKIKASITAGLKTAKPEIEVAAVEASAIEGLYKVSFNGASDIYASADGKHFLTGEFFEVRPGEIVNLTEFAKNKDRAKAVAAIEKKDMIVFSPKGEMKKAVYVFTDVDCFYCQKLHADMAAYNEMGIEVRYLGYPRAGLQSNSFKKLASAWCSDNPQDALTKVKGKQTIPENICATNPIAEQYGIGRQLGLTGTPALVLENGELISGYLDPARMKQRLKL